MAITQVRVKLGGSWTSLIYNASTGRWEGEITPPGTSVHQPGGYYSLTAEATNSTGQVDTLSGEQYAALRLVVRETAAPTLTIVSPSPGYLTTGTPTFVLDAVDEAGGSGVDPDSFGVTAGADDPAARGQIQRRAEVVPPYTAEPITNGCRFTWTPPGGWADGSHTVTFSVSDRDGNETSVSGAYLVDTVPPSLVLTLPDSHRVVDDEQIEIAGTASDGTSGVASVTVNGTILSQAAPDSSFAKGALPAAAGTGGFSAVVPLAVGVNNIPVAVTDMAGNTTTQSVWALRLITDRTQADADAAAALAGRSWASLTQAEQQFWLGVVRGAYNNEDLNRVGIAVEYLTAELVSRGYAPSTSPRTNWTEADAPDVPDLDTYLANVRAIRDQLPVSAPPVPEDMQGFTFQEANDIEANLVEADRFFPLMEKSVIYSGEGFCGEF